MINILIATGNDHKFQEIKAIIADVGADWLNISYLDGKRFPAKVEENGDTYNKNAKLKVDGYLKYLKENPSLRGKPLPDYIVAEDSGLEVECLNNEPGLRTARYAGEYATDAENITKLLDEMQKNKGCGEGGSHSGSGGVGRQARFVCYACLYDIKTGGYSYFEGELKGSISNKISGTKGFGYDPVFFVPEFNKTVAQVDSSEKNKISHRAIAFKQVAEAIKEIERL